MTVTSEHVAEVQSLTTDAVTRLSEARVAKARLTQFVPATRRFLVPRKARFVTLDEVWPLGVLLLSPAGDLYTAGETTRAVAPGYPGHVSMERERRREYTSIAFESGFEPGEVVYFDSPRIVMETGVALDTPGALATHEGRLVVRWNPTVSLENARPFAAYVSEQVALRLEREAPNE